MSDPDASADSDETVLAAHLRTLMRISPSFIFRTDAEGAVLQVNERWTDFTGRPPAAALGRQWPIVFHPDDRDRVVQEWLRVLGPGLDYQVEARIVHTDGRIIAVRVHAEPVRSGGRVLGYFGVVEDRSHQVEARASRLREQDALQVLDSTRARLDAFFQEAPAGLAIFDLGLEYWNVNEKLARINGISVEEHLGMTPGQVLGEYGLALEARFRQLLETGDTILDEPFSLAVPGRPASHFRFSAFPIRGSDDAIIGLGASIVDVTESTAAHLELQSLREELEERVVERTRELREAQDELLLRERFAVLGQLVATVSHEIRNPLGTIRNSSQALRLLLTPSSDSHQRILDRIDRSVIRCDKIIDELLDYTRVSKVQMRRARLAEIIEAVLVEHDVPEDIQVDQAIDPTARATLDPDRFGRCLINVINNACDAMNGNPDAEASRVLRIELPKPGDRVEVLVSDTGPGMTEEVVQHVFEPLFSTKSFGVGLGMSIVKRTMEQQGGGVEIESRVGRGTNVRLWLPLG